MPDLTATEMHRTTAAAGVRIAPSPVRPAPEGGPAPFPPAPAVDPGPCRIRWFSGPEQVRAVLPRWRDFLSRRPEKTLFDDPDFILESCGDRLEDLSIAVLVRDGETAAVVPFLRVRSPLRCHLGEVMVAKMPLRRVRLMGSGLRLIPDPDLVDEFLVGLASSSLPFDVVTLDGIPTGGPLDLRLSGNPRIRARYLRDDPDPALEQLTLDFQGDFETFFRGLSRRVRRHRAAKKLAVRGPVRLHRVTEPGDVTRFVQAAFEVSRRSWQFQLLERGIRDPRAMASRLTGLAERGNLRAYLLTCDDRPCAYKINYQDVNDLHSIDIAYDPEFASEAAGIVMLIRMMEDLFAWRTPRRFEFGGRYGYKDLFTNGSRLESRVWLYRKREYAWFALLTHRLTRGVSRAAVALVDRLGLKARLKSAMRRLLVRRL